MLNNMRRIYKTKVHYEKKIVNSCDLDSLCEKGGNNPVTTSLWNNVNCQHCLKLLKKPDEKIIVKK